ncbi:MAG: hypothetical protein QGH58_03325 [Arenicellales bacterium]|jgi:hypothetical protein|nr:hypothetical protein [Arenicellales bacterium]MDP6551567.1 hypothetical protein [Arenicellales bacterium]MDP6790919.1 hypothetical protein [Arenicellales bacterium]MDP6918466.1 hypothetical protein [Arenicellales bacterium]|tara:strand:+ start:280 stop:981 length:702 start_codon:yes stop_codon:yes gene_type:complete
MSPEELNVRKAIADVELIRRVLDQAEKSNSPAQTVGLFGVTLTANIILQSFALAGAALLLAVELATAGSITQTLMLGATLPDLRLLGIGLMAGILIALVILLYFVIWRAARDSGEEFNAYIVRNFRYARLLSYLSDLLLKFAAVALVMLAGHPEWIPPLLLAFTGDYLVQGRLFTLPTRMAVILGAICIAIGLYQFLADVQTLVLPLAVFTAVAAISTGRLMRLNRKQADEAA